jgi:hypothetical protein
MSNWGVATLVEHFVGQPLEVEWPGLDHRWPMIVALVSGGAISFTSGLNTLPA